MRAILHGITVPLGFPRSISRLRRSKIRNNEPPSKPSAQRCRRNRSISAAYQQVTFGSVFGKGIAIQLLDEKAARFLKLTDKRKRNG
jgi:hypothetical protein